MRFFFKTAVDRYEKNLNSNTKQSVKYNVKLIDLGKGLETIFKGKI